MDFGLGNNPVLDAIRARRSTRAFSDRPLERDKLEAILDAARWAPSGSNGQSWLFTAVTDPEKLEDLRGAVRAAAVNYLPDDDYPAKQRLASLAAQPDWRLCHGAPVLVIASNRPNYENAMADCALALGNIFLSAQSLGLGSCYINVLHWLRFDGPLREFLFGQLGIPREHTICGSAALGYIARESLPPPRKPGTFRIV